MPPLRDAVIDIDYRVKKLQRIALPNSKRTFIDTSTPLFIKS